MKRKKALGAVVAVLFSLVVGTRDVARSAPPSAPWHLDRINQAALPLDGNVDHGPLSGLGIAVYIVDTGVRPTHEQLVNRVESGIDMPTENGSSPVSPRSSDCDGHGTHVAGLAAGSTVGVATRARVIAVRVLDCRGDGEVADVVKALKWVRAHHRSGTAAVVNLSLGVDIGDDGTAIEKEVLSLIDDGVVVTVAAGNGDKSGRPLDACTLAPSRVPRALTVGATTVNDSFAFYSNNGSCIDVFAPGGDRQQRLESSWAESDTDYNFDVGTSMSSPLVAGYAALLAEQQPGLCVDSIANAIAARATVGAIRNLDAISPNRLLFINTDPIAATVPGKPSHLVTTSDRSSLAVSWDAPCDGGSPIMETVVTLHSNGAEVRRLSVPPGVSMVRFAGLTRGTKYKVVVQAANSLGLGEPTGFMTTVRVRSLRATQVIATRELGNIGGGLSLLWKVASSSRKTCRLGSSGTKITFLRSGTCRVALRAIRGQTPVIRSLRIAS